MVFSVRQATLNDLDLLCKLRLEVLRAVFDLPDSEDLHELKQANASYYRRTIPEGSHIAGLLYEGNEFAACGALCLQDEMPSPDNPNGRCAFLMNIYTRPQFRGQGAGVFIVDWLIKQAHAHEATKIYLESTDAARSLYAGYGFVDMHDYLILADKRAEPL